MPATFTKSGPGLGSLAKRLRDLRKSEVLVGIPASRTQRKGEPINNASLLYIQSKGSDLQGIPARPVLEPSIEANKDLIVPRLGAAAQAMLQKNPERAENELKRAGVVAANGAKRWFTNPENAWQPNAPSTIAAKGSDRPLIDTGSMRRAITSVVRVDGNEIGGGGDAA